MAHYAGLGWFGVRGVASGFVLRTREVGDVE